MVAAVPSSSGVMPGVTYSRGRRQPLLAGVGSFDPIHIGT